MTAKNCHARQYGDQVCCGRCGTTWDANDPEPPTCREDAAEQKQPGVDELAAQVQVMRGALISILDHPFEIKAACDARRALSVTPSAALREVKARTLEEAADNWTGFIQVESGDETATQLREMAAAIRKGE